MRLVHVVTLPRQLAYTDTVLPCNFSSGATSFCNGLWTTSGQLNWTQTHGPVAFHGTGPNAGPSGGSYLHLQPDGAENAWYIIKLEAALLTSASGQFSEVTFKYHMFGPAIGTVEVEVKSSGTWTKAWVRSGQQHKSKDAPWSTARIAFDEPVDRVRFVGTIGSNWKHRTFGSMYSIEYAAAVTDVELVGAAGLVPYFAFVEGHFWI